MRARRIQVRLTQEELAARAGLSVRTVRNLESGRGGTSRPETQRLLIAALRPSGAEPAGGDRLAAPAQLPFGVAGFVGRDRQLHELDRLLDQHHAGDPAPVVISAIAGAAGVGKSALAVHWGHRARGNFIDGQLYADLRGFTPGVEPVRPLEVLVTFLRALGVPHDEIPTDQAMAADLYRTKLADRRMLVLLDNARNPAQVRPLLPGGLGNLVLVTSRDKLDGLIAREGARRLALDVLDDDEAHCLLQRILGADRVAAEPDAAAALVKLCAGLPLAIRIAATNLHGRPDQSIRTYVATLGTDRLGRLAVAGDPDSVVRPAFEASYRLLPPAPRRLFRRLGMVPGPDFTAETAAVLIGVGRTEAARLLEQLVRIHLIENRAPERFACHDLLRHYARQLLTNSGDHRERDLTLELLYGHYLDQVDAAASLLYPQLLRLPAPRGAGEPGPAAFADEEPAVAWLDAEVANLVAAVAYAADHGPRPAAWRLADGMRGYLAHRMHTIAWLTCAEAGLTAARHDGHLGGQVACQLSLATLHSRLGDQPRAVGEYRQALTLAQQAGWTEGIAAAYGGLGNAHWRRGQVREASEAWTSVLRQAQQTGQVTVQAKVLTNLGLATFELGDLQRSADQYRQALTLARQLGSSGLEANAEANLGEALHALGQLDRAMAHLIQALARHRKIGDHDSEGHALGILAAVLCDRGRQQQALRLAEQAHQAAGRSGHHRYQVDAANALGTICCLIGRFPLALEHHRQALHLARSAGYRHGIARSLIGKAEVDRHQARLEPALSSLREALQIAADHGYRVTLGQARTELAELHLRLGEPEPAVAAAGSALELQQGTGHRLGQARAHAALAAAIRTAGDAGAASAHVCAARQLVVDAGGDLTLLRRRAVPPASRRAS